METIPRNIMERGMRLKTLNVESREMNDLKRDDDITCLV